MSEVACCPHCGSTQYQPRTKSDHQYYCKSCSTPFNHLDHRQRHSDYPWDSRDHLAAQLAAADPDDLGGADDG